MSDDKTLEEVLESGYILLYAAPNTTQHPGKWLVRVARSHAPRPIVEATGSTILSATRRAAREFST